MINLIGLMGPAQSGKDSSAVYLKELGYERVGFADMVRESLYRLNPWILTERGPRRLQDIIDEIGWDEAKRLYPEVRELQQRMGTEVGRELYSPTFWIWLAERQMIHDELQKVVVTDVRFQEEIDWIHSHKGIVIGIRRPGVGPVNSHVSDSGISRLVPDWYIDNNGTLDDLRTNVLGLAQGAWQNLGDVR
jgi:hypothetical protein